VNQSVEQREPAASQHCCRQSLLGAPWAGFGPLTQSPTPPTATWNQDEAALGPQAVSPFVHETEGRDKGTGSPRGHQELAKPKAIIPRPSYAIPLTPVPQPQTFTRERCRIS